MRRVLVAVDGSDNALRALDFAVDLARSGPATELHVMTVRAPVRVYGEIAVYATEEHMRELASQQVQAALDTAAGRLASSDVRFTLEQVEGPPGETIARRADELGCKLIVMGTHGRGRVGSLLMGSVAQTVVHLATVPVTLVK